MTDKSGGFPFGMFGGDDGDAPEFLKQMLAQAENAAAGLTESGKAMKLKTALELQEVEQRIEAVLAEAEVATAEVAVCRADLLDPCLTPERRRVTDMKIAALVRLAASRKVLAESLSKLYEVQQKLAEVALAQDPASFLAMFGGSAAEATPPDDTISGNPKDPRGDVPPPADGSTSD